MEEEYIDYPFKNKKLAEAIELTLSACVNTPNNGTLVENIGIEMNDYFSTMAVLEDTKDWEAEMSRYDFADILLRGILIGYNYAAFSEIPVKELES